MRSKTICTILAVLLAAAFAGCSGGGKPYATPEPIVTPVPTAVPDSGTPDPGSSGWIDEEIDNEEFTLVDGHYEDAILTVDLPKMLGDPVTDINTRTFAGKLEDGTGIGMTYIWDNFSEYETDVAKYDFDSYNEYLTTVVSSDMKLLEYNNITVDGHRGVKAAFDYTYEDRPTVHIVQYSIEVHGWVLGFTASTNGEIPPELDEGIMALKFKEGF